MENSASLINWHMVMRYAGTISDHFKSVSFLSRLHRSLLFLLNNVHFAADTSLCIPHLEFILICSQIFEKYKLFKIQWLSRVYPTLERILGINVLCIPSMKQSLLRHYEYYLGKSDCVSLKLHLLSKTSFFKFLYINVYLTTFSIGFKLMT